MKTIRENVLMQALSQAQKTRLLDFRRNLSLDRDKVNFDSRVEAVLKNYVYNKSKFEAVKSYLNNLRDDDGYLFSQSLKQYSKLERQIRKFSEPSYTSFRWNRNYQAALKLVEDFVKSDTELRQVNYYCDDDIIDAVPKSDTHSGFSYILTGKRYKGEYFDGVFNSYVREENEARIQGSFNKCILPGVRTQGSGAFNDETGVFTNYCKHKTRLVSMIDIYQIIAELKFAKPFQQRLAQVNQYAGGKDNSSISDNIYRNIDRYNYWICLDYSSFDQTISDWLIRDAFQIIKNCFHQKDFDDELFNIIQEDFIHKNFITANGIIHADKGVPSGSMFTQIIDSLVNLICISTYMISIDEPFDCIVMGDDNLLFTKHEIKPDLIASYLRKNFGLEVNPSKMNRGVCRKQYPSFLSRVWKPLGQWRHPNVLISKMLFPERFRPYGTQPVRPEDVIYGYILAYPEGMTEFMNVGKFLDDYLIKEDLVLNVVSHYVPGALSFNAMYLMDKGDNPYLKSMRKMKSA